MMDVLTDVLSTLRLRGTVYFQADFCAPWGMDIKGGAVANFHLVVRGRCWLRGPDPQPSRELNEGDVIVLAHGGRHALLHAPEADALPSDVLLGHAGATQSERPKYGGNGEATTLICGHYVYERAGAHPLLRALPPLIHLRKEEQTQWMETASRLTALESSSSETGSSAVADRLAEVLLIQVVRAHAKRLTQHDGFLASLSEPTIATALALLHADPARSWRLAEVANACSVSSTVLVERFKHTLGVAPMHYLTHWRMHKARGLLIESHKSVPQIAQTVGYASEWSFAKAYKRVFGEGPGATRKAARA